MLHKYQIEIATENDVETLVSFGKEEFSRTFGHLYAPKDLEAYLLEGYATQNYVNWVNDSEYRIFVAFNGRKEALWLHFRWKMFFTVRKLWL